MQLKALLVTVGIFVAPSAEAAEWWWFGLNGQEPNRTLTYLDRASIDSIERRIIQVTTIAIGESPLPNAQQTQVNRYHIDCKKRWLGLQRRIALDGSGTRIPLSDIQPEALIPAKPGSVGDTILNFSCGKPSGLELLVSSPVEHAMGYFGKASRAEDAQESVVQSGLSLGTGFFVGPNGDVLTSYHVIEGATMITCRTIDGIFHPATLERGSAANDLALLKVKIKPNAYLDLAPIGSIKPGDRVFTFGFGAANYLGINEARYTEGNISALSGLGAEDAYMQISVPVQPGNSGGPLVNDGGQVVGVIAAQAAIDAFLKAEGTLPQNINWAVKAGYAAPLVGHQIVSATRNRAEGIVNARKSLCLIVAESSKSGD